MQEVFRTSEAAEIALVKSLLESAKIKFFVFDEYLASSMGPLVGDTAECRFMVLEHDFEAAFILLDEAGLFKDEDYVDLMATQDEAEAEKVQQLLDKNGIGAIIEEDKPDDGGIISGIGNTPATYYLVVPESAFDEACDILEASGIMTSEEPHGTRH